MNEYYIRREGDEEASGPYDMDAIVSLFEANKLDKDAFYYDMDIEEWRRIGDNEEMLAIIFPEKRKLTLRPDGSGPEEAEPQDESPAEEADAAEGKGQPDAGKEGDAEGQATADGEKGAEEDKDKGGQESRRRPKLKPRPEKKAPPKPITVEAMLAQAEGRDDTRPDSKSPAERQAQAAFIGMQSTMVLLFLNAVAMGLLRLDLIQSANAPRMAKDPFILMGALDFILGFVLLMQVTQVYSLIRFRCFLGIGLVSVLLIASGDPLLAGANVLICLAIFLSTAIIHTPKLIGFLAMGLVGIALYAYKLALPLLQGFVE